MLKDVTAFLRAFNTYTKLTKGKTVKTPTISNKRVFKLFYRLTKKGLM